LDWAISKKKKKFKSNEQHNKATRCVENTTLTFQQQRAAKQNKTRRESWNESNLNNQHTQSGGMKITMILF
jgi:hypothetical protein